MPFLQVNLMEGRSEEDKAELISALTDTVCEVLGSKPEQVRVLLRFADYTDPDRPYMYHCHILEHEDAGMMGQFTVTA